MQVKSAESLEELKAQASQILDEEYPSKESLINSLERNGKDQIKSTLGNLMMIFRLDPFLKGAICKNEMTGRIDLVRNLGWNKAGDTITDVDVCWIFKYFEDTYQISNDRKVRQAISMISSENKYHPVKNFLESLHWDGEKRIDGLLNKYLGVDINDYTKEVMHLLMQAMIHRVYHPGCKFEIMICLVGGQGAGKSSFFRLLSGMDDWFSDDLKRLEDDKVYRKLQGHWLIEMSEMLATANARSIEDIKSFLSRQKDSYKIPYEVHPEDRPRQCVFVGTSNNLDFLPLDRSGNRRFAPVLVHHEKIEHHILENEQESREYINLAWAEAFEEYRNAKKHSLKFSREIEKQLPEIQKEFMPEDEKAGLIRAWLDQTQEVYVCALMIYREALNHEYDDPKRWELREINNIMNEEMKDWEHFSNHRFSKYGQQRSWRKKNRMEADFIPTGKQVEIPFDLEN